MGIAQSVNVTFDGHADDLGDAAAEAVRRSQYEVERLLIDVELLVSELRASPSRLAAWEAAIPLSKYRIFTEALVDGATRDFDGQVEGLESFNIVLFGRTGSGKSSLLSAMARLDGALVSHGESDWTTVPHDVLWHGVRLVDTPGIDGWGRTMSREELESRAREEVKKADIVLLCFDTQSQQASEFSKVATWVVEFGKPVVAVLNNRNARWRQPSDVPSATARRNLTQAVRQHVGHIEDNLDALGLGHVPVIVISARRALDARAVEPYQGPDAAGRARRLERSNANQLLADSNLPVLEAFFVAMVSTGAVDLRLASLRDGARAVHRNAELELLAVDSEAAAGCGLIDEAIASSLRVLGYPSPEVRLQRLRDDRVRSDLLTSLEDMRGEPFDAPTRGALDAYARSLLNSHLKPLELESLTACEEAIRTAFDQGSELSEAEFTRQVFKDSAIEMAAQLVWSDSLEYARQKLALITSDADADAVFSARTFSAAGGAGRGWRSASFALRAGGIAASILTAVAVTQGWNPVGWAAAACAVVLSFFGKSAARKAERTKLQARNRALGEARRTVRDAYRDLRRSLREQIVAAAWEAAEADLRGKTASSLGFRLLREEIRVLCAGTAARAGRIPPAPDVPEVLHKAVIRILARAGTRNAAAVLWGEDWLEDGQPSEAAAAPRRALRAGNALVDAFRSIVPSLQPTAAASWAGELKSCEHSELALIGEEFALPSAVPIALVGDYNSGKSSLVKRLLIEAGRPVPPDLVVGAKPTTAEARSHDVDGAVLIDTPGMQSGVADHEERALEILGEAAVILMTFHPNLVLGDTRLLAAVAEGTPLTPPRHDHAVALVNRADELGVDPRISPEEFGRLCARKREELVSALERHRMPIPPTRTWCMASDPFGLVGDSQNVTADSYADNADWDGVDVLIRGLHELEGPLGDQARAMAGVVTAVSRLMRRSVDVASALAADEARRTELRRVEAVISRAATRAEQLRADLAATAEEFIATHARGAYDEMLRAETEKDIDAAARQFEHWYEDELFLAELDDWAAGAEEQINAWATETSSELLREFNRREMRAAFSGMPTVDLGALRQDDSARVGMHLAHDGLNALVKTFSNRDAVYRVGKALGYKFRPWEAVGKARAVGKLGPWLAGLGVVLDGADWAIDVHRAGQRERARARAHQFLRDSVTAVTDYVLKSDDLDGPVQHLARLVASLVEVSRTIADEQGELAGRIGFTTAELRMAEQFIDSGRALLDPQREGATGEHVA